jgi:acyl carrier protein
MSEVDTSALDLDQATARMIEIWSRFFPGAEITPESHLLDLGANSMTAVRIRSRIRAELGREIELVDLLEHPTPAALSAVVVAAPVWQGMDSWHQVDWSDDQETETAP